MNENQDTDPFDEAQQIENLRERITHHAAGAVSHGLDRDWVNARLAAIGAQPITGQSIYKMNVPMTGLYGRTISAGSRAEAVELFNKHVARTIETGKINVNSNDNVYRVEFPAPATELPTFFSGPEDPPVVKVPTLTLEQLKDAIRQLLKDGVSDQGWSYRHAANAGQAMGLKDLPALETRTVAVPVSGMANVSIKVFEGDDDEAVQKATAGVLARLDLVGVKPDEIGSAVTTRTGEEDVF